MKAPRVTILLVGLFVFSVVFVTPAYMRNAFRAGHSSTLSTSSIGGMNVEALNQPPITRDDNYTVHRFLALLPLSNDTDPEGGTLRIGSFIQAAHGWVSPYSQSTVIYTPNYGYAGSDSFTYSACDDLGACTNGTVNIQVVNQPPLAQPDNYAVHRNLGLVPLANDSDPDPGDSINIRNMVNGPTQHGWLSPYGPNVYTYTANYGYVGSDTFDYTVCDDLGACSTGTVSINVVNEAPVARPDLYVVRAPLAVAPRQNDFDPDPQDALVFQGITSQPQHGSLSPSNPSVFIYTPYSGYTGSDSFTYTVCDDLGACSLGIVTLWVIGNGENDGVCSTCNKGGPGAIGGPVNVTNGNMYLQQGDYALTASGPGINITRTYNSNSQRIGLFGRGWTTSYDESINAYDSNLARFNQSDGRAIYLARAAGASGALSPLEGDFHGSLVQNGGSSFTLTLNDGSVQQFNSAGKLISLADRNGNQTTLAYDTSGKLASATDPFGRVLSFTTNNNGQVLSISDAVGTIGTYAYGPANQLLSVTYPDNSGFQFTYDGNFRLTTVTDALGNVVESHTYNSQGRALTSEKQGGVEKYTLSYVSGSETDVTDALSHVTKFRFDTSKGRNVVAQVEGLCNCGSGSQSQTWTYDNQLNVISRTNALNQSTSYTYDVSGNRLTETDATGTVTYTYNQFAEVLTRADQMDGVTTNTYDAAGNLLTTKDPLNNTTTFTYDVRGQLLTMTNALGKVTTLTWDTGGRLIQAKDAANSTTNFAYDARARLTSVTNALNFVTSYAYDAAGRVNKITRPDNSFITYTYDLAGRRTKVTDALNNNTSFAYDSAYRLTSVTDAALKATTYSFDLMSNLISATDALSHTTNYEYDEFNRLIKTVYPPAVISSARLQESVEYDPVGNVTKRIDTAGRITSFAYDSANRLATVTDPASQTTQYEYNPRSNVTALVDALSQRYTFSYDALSRVTTATRAGLQVSFAYDAVGNRTGRTDYNNMATGYTYDSLKRLTKITYPDASTATYGYDKLSQLTSATNINGTVSFVYDSLGRTTSTTDVFGQVLNYVFDANDRRTKLSFGATTSATYAYDVVNRLTKITDSANLAVSYVYDAGSNLTSRTLPNGIATTYTYDGLDRVTRLKDLKSKTVIADNQYSYNNAGDITQNIDQSGTHSYAYDAIERLTSATYTGAPSETYAYDGVGNRTSSHKSAVYGYQPNNRLVTTSTASYLYDNNGNSISKSDATGITQFSWDFENRLTQVVTPSSGSVSYKYDALGRRIQRSPSSGVSTNFVYDGQDVVKDINSDGTTVEYLNGPGIDNKIRQKGSSNSTTYYFSQDHLGSTTVLTGTTGKVVERTTYDAYGNSAGSTRTRYGYTGRERDQLTGLLYYRSRFYDPQLGRFISEDPIGFAGGINSFAYVSNNPQNATDPQGLYEIDVHYYLTYYLASKHKCFSLSDAKEIAEGDQRTDEDERTKPGPFRAYQNATYHALHPGSHQPYLDNLFQEATRGHTPGQNMRAFGVYLHYLQDMFSHAGYPNSNIGHLTGTHRVDKTDSDVSKAMEMAQATWDALNRYAKEEKCGCQDAQKLPWPVYVTVKKFASSSGGGVIGRNVYTMEGMPYLLDLKRQILGVPVR